MLLSKEKSKEDYKLICLQLEYELYKKDKEIKRKNNIINNIKKEYELFMQSDFNENNCITFINKIEKELKEKSDNNE